MDDKTLRDKLQRPVAPNELEQRIRANWQAQQKADGRHRRMLIPGTAIAASILLAVVLLQMPLFTPSIVDAAARDIIADAERNPGISIPVDNIVQARGLQAPLPEMTVKMTKRCTLNALPTVHMQIAGANQGEVHLFIADGPESGVALQNRQGELDSLHWQLLTPREDLTLLVLHTSDMNPDNVERLLRHMFYS